MQNATLNHAVAQADNVEMVSVSFDEYKSIFNETIKKDQISTSNCFVELAGVSSDLYQTYRLKRGFKNFLLDENGVIVAKDITVSELSSYLNWENISERKKNTTKIITVDSQWNLRFFLLYGILLTYIIYHSQSNAYLYGG